jgi:hypothetical protein
MESSSYKYDVAFTFLDRDEPIARQLSDSFEGRLSTFVFSERQAELGGKDGVDTLCRVFKTESRIVVILYREGWGQTPWTGIEEDAIKDRRLKVGHDFILVVRLSGSHPTPEWFPEARIWLDLERFGMKVVAGIIEHRVRERGGEPKEETASGRAARLRRDKETSEARERFLNSEEGVEAAKQEAIQVVAEIQRLSLEISNSGEGVGLYSRRPQNARVQITHEVGSYGFKVIVAWCPQWNNTLRNSGFWVTLVRTRRSYEGSPEELDQHIFAFDKTAEGICCWTDTTHDLRSFSSLQLADFCLKLLLNALDEHKPWEVR